MNTSKNALILLLQLDPTKELQLVNDSLSTGLDPAIKATPVQDLYELALSERNDLKSAEAGVKARKAEVFFSRAEYYPSISLFYRYGTNFSSFQEGEFNRQFFTDNITKELGVSLSIPIFNGFRTRTSVFQTKMTYENTLQDFELLKNQIYTELDNIRNTLVSNEEERNYRGEQLKATQITFELEQEKYLLGAGTPVTLALAQRDYIEASLLLNQIDFLIVYNLFQLNFFCGTI